MKKIKTLLLLLCLSTGIFAQQFDAIQKTYEISGKAKRGSLVNVKYDKTNGSYKLYYVIKSGLTTITLQIYSFDKDFNFIDVKNEEVPVDNLAQMKKENPFDFSWVNFKGANYSVEGNSVEGNLVGNLVIKKKRITYFYNWFNMNYDSKIELLDKVKPK